MSKAKVAILMVSQAFLVSAFIRNEELPELLSAAEKEHATIMWIPVSASNVDSTFIEVNKGDEKGKKICIADYQAAGDPAKPLRSLSKHKRDEIYLKLQKDVKECF